MARQPEGIIKDSCRKVAKAHGLLFVQVESKGINGWPDTEAGKYPKGSGMCLLEFKTPVGTLSMQQERRHAEIRGAGGEVHVCRSVEDYEVAVGLKESVL